MNDVTWADIGGDLACRQCGKICQPVGNNTPDYISYEACPCIRHGPNQGTKWIAWHRQGRGFPMGDDQSLAFANKYFRRIIRVPIRGATLP